MHIYRNFVKNLSDKLLLNYKSNKFSQTPVEKLLIKIKVMRKTADNIFHKK